MIATPNVIRFATRFFSQEESLGGIQEWKSDVLKAVNVRSSHREYYAYLLITRNHFNSIRHSGKLMQQFVVDTWMKIEQNHLKSIRQNQALLRVDTYRGLQAFMVADESDGGPPGRNIVLPASYSGSPRDIGAKYQDALSIVARYGKPDLFINVTCNPHAARTSRKNSRSMHQWRAMDIQGIEEKTVGVLSCVEE
ncbi:hypothetical protein ANCDUO_01955 [Ancylostoma duodenale]|uniref:Helitron helicase-like domain-containing protein n=1 Tax=Ancylostoma duodenale TaxID=51022 RepID=A0A0C2DXM0_9BILA|nr:hypothetical protein ANCDUO_01955 [Ancylostoma duodenale]